MNFDLKLTTQHEQLLFVALCVVTGLLLISFVRIWVLLRGCKRLREREERLERQILDQQKELMAVRADAAAWRGEMQRQFDGFRSEASQRQAEALRHGAEVQRRLDVALEKHERQVFELQASLDAARRMCAELPDAKARIIELERQLGAGHGGATNGAPVPRSAELQALAVAAKSVAHLPELPSMETLEGQGDDPLPDVTAIQDDLASIQQRNTELQRALMLARRRKAPPRKSRR